MTYENFTCFLCGTVLAECNNNINSRPNTIQLRYRDRYSYAAVQGSGWVKNDNFRTRWIRNWLVTSNDQSIHRRLHGCYMSNRLNITRLLTPVWPQSYVSSIPLHHSSNLLHSRSSTWSRNMSLFVLDIVIDQSLLWSKYCRQFTVRVSVCVLTLSYSSSQAKVIGQSSRSHDKTFLFTQKVKVKLGKPDPATWKQSKSDMKTVNK